MSELPSMTATAINTELIRRYATEDTILQQARVAATTAGLPTIEISPLQGKLLQVLAAACSARKILEIGALGGYSGIWIARALPTDGKLITLEISPKHAEVVRANFALAGLTDRTEVRVGAALDILPSLGTEAPFDLIFIDADKANYPGYLDWALQYSRIGTIIVADNVIRMGRPFQPDISDPDTRGLATYNDRIASEPRLLSVAFPMDDDGLDGFGVSVVIK